MKKQRSQTANGHASQRVDALSSPKVARAERKPKLAFNTEQDLAKCIKTCSECGLKDSHYNFNRHIATHTQKAKALAWGSWASNGYWAWKPKNSFGKTEEPFRPHKEKPDHFLNVVVCIIHMFHDGICVPYEYMHYGQHASTAYFGIYKKNPQVTTAPSRAHIKKLERCYMDRIQFEIPSWLEPFFSVRLQIKRRNKRLQATTTGDINDILSQGYQEVSVDYKQKVRATSRSTQTELLGIAGDRTLKQMEKIRMQLSFKLRCNAKISATASAPQSAVIFLDGKDDEINDKFNIDGNLGEQIAASQFAAQAAASFAVAQSAAQQSATTKSEELPITINTGNAKSPDLTAALTEQDGSPTEHPQCDQSGSHQEHVTPLITHPPLTAKQQAIIRAAVQIKLKRCRDKSLAPGEKRALIRMQQNSAQQLLDVLASIKVPSEEEVAQHQRWARLSTQNY